MKIEKPKTCRDESYLSWCRNWLCCIICGQQPAYPHHFGRRGVAIKGSDHSVVSLCHEHHAEIHQKGRLTFEAKYKFTLDEIAPKLYAKYLEMKEKGLVK